MWNGPLEKIDQYRWRIPASYKKGMRVDGLLYADQRLLEEIKKDKAAEQVANVAFLPGIVGNSLAMPDVHWGYGFSIGGVAATDPDNGGVISPGGVGFDINCGVRMMRSALTLQEVGDRIEELVTMMYKTVPAGLGSKGEVKVSYKEEKRLLVDGAGWAVARGFGVKEDVVFCEESGAIEGADPDSVSERAYTRGKRQVGTLGSGNHFLEVQVIDEIFEEGIAQQLGLQVGQISVMIHSGSRGFGYQVCDDYIKVMRGCLSQYDIQVPDRQLVCAPVTSPEAKRYVGAMRAAANYAWANRQVLMHLIRESFEKVFGQGWQSLGLSLVYDIAHNIAKFEKYTVEGKKKTLCVHRKGATRAFGPGNPALPQAYQNIGQPVIIPGDMGTASYLLVGTKKAEEETFGSTCHGAGRVMSRHEALKTIHCDALLKELQRKGVAVRAAGKKTLVEEAPSVYKDINAVIDVVHGAGLSKKVCRMRPLCVVKG